MKKFVILLLILFFPGCYIFYHPAYAPPPGILYENSILPFQMNPPSDLGNKTGSSCIKSFLGVVTIGNASIQAAAASKGIRTIKAVEYQKISFILGAYTRLCTIVHGE